MADTTRAARPAHEPDTATGTGAGGPGRSPALRDYVRPIGFYLASRLATVAAVVVGTRTTGLSLSQALGIWDSQWYSIVAGEGYPGGDPFTATGVAGHAPSNPAFFPLFPLLIRGAAAVTGWSTLSAGLAVATVLGGVAVCLLWALTRELFDAAVADRAAALFSFAPGAIVFTMAYSEPAMLVAAITCLLALRRERWLAAGLAAAAATATRPNAIVLAACCAWAALAAVRRERDWGALAAPLLAPAGMLAYFALLWARTGEPAAWFIVQRTGWNERVDFGATNLWEVPRTLGLVPPAPNLTTVIAVGGLAVTLLLAVAMARAHLPAELVIYTVGILGLAFVSHTLGLRPRFVETAFPLVIGLAYWARGWRFGVTLALSGAAMVVLAIVYTIPSAAVP